MTMFKYWKKGENNLPIQNSVPSKNIFQNWRWHKGFSRQTKPDDSLLAALITTNVEGMCSDRGNVLLAVKRNLAGQNAGRFKTY